MPTVLCAHGINGHVHVTAWSMAEIEEQGVLEILDDPVAVDALLLVQPFQTPDMPWMGGSMVNASIGNPLWRGSFAICGTPIHPVQ